MFLNVFVGRLPQEAVPVEFVGLRAEFFSQGLAKVEAQWVDLVGEPMTAGVYDEKLKLWVSNLLFMDDTVLLGAGVGS